MKKIIIIQHCQSEHHINNMSGGWTDTPLTDLGRKQAELLGMRLKKELEENEYVLYSSDLMRANQTADIIGKHLSSKVIVERGLREINTGIAAGKTKEWCSENRNPLKGNKFYIDYQEFEDGETWREFYSRLCDCMERICASEEKDLIIVTHGCALSYIVAWWMKFEPEMLAKAYFSASPGSISILQENIFGQNFLRLLNDTSHLAELK
ncbi:histidine phosphatase family protein [Oceanirhabdus sp. W0125-5]|uniref:histidine phosphatase family protein n=1 Tax=Oceanirhabdus sp. W0125-5 TaxID=2999116 RepID=UPI0022F2DA4B|nr:histidine phosphatase family protein [Oceanirhabdus sp. W0125-5]WBW96413.1 histidine phosphatase family protein [Oceanirhabdus sp. W0125-5]